MHYYNSILLSTRQILIFLLRGTLFRRQAGYKRLSLASQGGQLLSQQTLQVRTQSESIPTKEAQHPKVLNQILTYLLFFVGTQQEFWPNARQPQTN